MEEFRINVYKGKVITMGNGKMNARLEVDSSGGVHFTDLHCTSTEFETICETLEQLGFGEEDQRDILTVPIFCHFS